MAVPSFEELFNQQQYGGLGQAGWPQGTGGAGWPGEEPQQTPPAAAPTNGQMPPGYPQAPPPPPQGSGLGNIGDALASRSNTMIGMGLGMMGGGWAGGARGFAAGAPVDERMAAAKLAQQQHAAALAQNQAHFERQQALAEAPQLVKVKGLLGEELMLRDPRSGKLTPYTGPSGSAGGVGVEGGNFDEEGYDKGYLEALRKKSPEAAAAVEAIAEGRIPAGGFGAQKQFVPYAARYKQGFDAKDYATHLGVQKSFTSGKDSETTRRMNQAYFHADKAYDLSEKLGGVPVGGTAGAIGNRIYSEYYKTTDPQYQQDEAEYSRQATYLANEMIAAAKGGSGSDVRAAHEAAASLQASIHSPAARRGAIKGALDFLEGVHSGLEQKLEIGRQKGFMQHMPDLLRPESRAAIEKIQSGPAPAAPGQAGAGTGTAPAQAQPGAARPPGPAAPGMKWQTNGTDWRQVPK